MTTLVRWFIRALVDNWPGGVPGDTDPGGPVYFIDRDDAALLEVDTSASPTTLSVRRYLDDGSFELTVGNSIGVSYQEATQTPAGLGGREYRADPVLSVRVEGAHERVGGDIASADEFSTDLAQQAQDTVRKHIDNGTLQAAPVADFHVAEPNDERPRMDESTTYYRWDFDVEPRGYRTV